MVRGCSFLAAAFLLTSLSPAVVAPARAQAQEATCSGKVLVGFVYAVMIRRDAYEYRAYLRNLTERTIGWTLMVGSLPDGVSPPLEHPMRGFLGPHAGETLRIGRGPTAAINLATVEVFYDRVGGVAPFISLTGCSERTARSAE
jgi:hypothetical protein